MVTMVNAFLVKSALLVHRHRGLEYALAILVIPIAIVL